MVGSEPHGGASLSLSMEVSVEFERGDFFTILIVYVNFIFYTDVLRNVGGSSEETSSVTSSLLLASMFPLLKQTFNERRFVFPKTAAFL